MSIQEIPATISAFNADAIRESNIENVADVVNLIPNAQAKSYKAVSRTSRTPKGSRIRRASRN